jgi:uncharacterized protein (DUF2141 family)
MPPRSSRPRRILLLLAAITLVALSVSAASANEKSKVSVDITASEQDANGVTVPEFVATSEWQELLPGQGVPRVNAVSLSSF